MDHGECDFQKMSNPSLSPWERYARLRRVNPPQARAGLPAVRQGEGLYDFQK